MSAVKVAFQDLYDGSSMLNRGSDVIDSRLAQMRQQLSPIQASWEGARGPSAKSRSSLREGGSGPSLLRGTPSTNDGESGGERPGEAEGSGQGANGSDLAGDQRGGERSSGEAFGQLHESTGLAVLVGGDHLGCIGQVVDHCLGHDEVGGAGPNGKGADSLSLGGRHRDEFQGASPGGRGGRDEQPGQPASGVPPCRLGGGAQQHAGIARHRKAQYPGGQSGGLADESDLAVAGSAEHSGTGRCRAEPGEHPRANVHRRAGAPYPEHVPEPFGPAQVGHEEHRANHRSAERDDPTRLNEPPIVAAEAGELRSSSQRGRSACHAADGEVGGHLPGPTGLLDDALAGLLGHGGLRRIAEVASVANPIADIELGPLAGQFGSPDVDVAAVAAKLTGGQRLPAAGRVLHHDVGPLIVTSHQARFPDSIATATPAAITPSAPAIDLQPSFTVFCGATGLVGSE